MAAQPSIGPIQVIPQGLLGLVDLKTSLLPDVLKLDVQPQFDVLDFWLRAQANVDTATHSIALPTGLQGTFVGFTTGPILVPENETWFVHEYSADCNLNAGAADLVSFWQLAMRYSQTAPNARWAAMTPGLAQPGSAAGETRLQTAFKFWAPPGSQLGLYISNIVLAAGNVTFRGYFRITRCRI